MSEKQTPKSLFSNIKEQPAVVKATNFMEKTGTPALKEAAVSLAAMTIVAFIGGLGKAKDKLTQK